MYMGWIWLGLLLGGIYAAAKVWEARQEAEEARQRVLDLEAEKEDAEYKLWLSRQAQLIKRRERNRNS